MPALSAVCTASLASMRSGSMIPTSATRVRSVTAAMGSAIVEVAGGEREHPQPALGELAVGGQNLVPDGTDRYLLAVPQRVTAVVHDHVGRTLHGGEVRLPQDPAGAPVGAVVERG